MPTVTKVFSFTNSTVPYTAEGGTWTVVDGVATVGSIVAAANAPTDPSGSAFGLQESCTGKNKTNAGNYWQWAGTWEDLGVPSGAGWVVSDIVVTQAWRCSTFTTGAASGNNIGPTELRDSGGTLLAQGTQTAFTTTTAFTDRASPTLTVPASSGASTTSIQIRLGNDLATGNSTSAVVTLQQDYVRVQINYGLPATVTPATLAAVAAMAAVTVPASATATPAVLAAVAAMGAVTPSGGGGGGGGITARTAPAPAETASGLSVTGNLPSDLATGDVVIAHFAMSCTVAQFTPPSGWTQLVAPTSDGSVNMTAAYYRFDPPAGPTGTSSGTAGRQTCITQGYGGVDATTPVDVAAQINVGSSPVTIGSISIATANARLICGIEINASTGTWTGPTGMTVVKTHTSGVGRGGAVADETRSSTGATGTRQWTWSGTTQASAGYLVALRPAAGGGGGATATPATIACTAALPAPTIRVSTTATPQVVAAVAAFGAVKRLFAFAGTTGTITGLQASSSYQVTVRAVDTSGNRSADSAPVTVTTTAPGAAATPATLAAVTAMPAVTATGSGNATATPATLAATTTVGAPVLHAGSVVSPATLAAVAAIPAPAVTAGGSATAIPATLAAVTAVGAPTLHADTTATPATLAATTAVGAPTVTAGGGATATPATLAATTIVGAPTITVGGSRTPATIAAVAAMPAAAVGGSAQVSAATITATAAVGAAVLHTGSTVTPAAIAAVTAVGAPAVTGGSSGAATPARIQAVAAIGTPTITVSVLVTAQSVLAVASIGAPSVRYGSVVAVATLAARATMALPVVQVKITYRPFVGSTARPGTGTTGRPYAGTTVRP